MKRILFLLIAVAASALVRIGAQDVDSVPMPQAPMLAMPLVYSHYLAPVADPLAAPSTAGQDMLNANDGWLVEAMAASQRQRQARYRIMVKQPYLTLFNEQTLPEAPQQRVLAADPTKALLSIGAPQIGQPLDSVIEDAPLKIHNWLHTFVASLHFTQAYISRNWYQGGENNVNILADIKWDCNLNQDVHPKWLFNNSLHYKLGVTRAHNDSLRNYMINEDNFLFTSQLGYKAVKHWYYSAMLQFKTQFFNNYKSNTNDMTASFLSPAELNIGLGMTYDYKHPDGIRVLTVALAPLSYNLRICRDITRLNPTTFGIDAGHHTKSSFGSTVEIKYLHKFTPNISWQSRLYAFTDYSYVQGDWENTFDFAVNRYLNTQIYAHLRYDKSHPRDHKWRYWQFKEILSFGLTYRFATN